jgi:OmpA-OmpF porin, OOP family
MKRTLHTTAVCGAALLMSAALAGCGSSGSSSDPTTSGEGISTGTIPGTIPGSSCSMLSGAPVALAIGARSNNPAPNLTAAATSLLNSAIKKHEQVSVIRLDGAPKIVFNEAFTPTGANSQSQQVDYTAYVNNLNQILGGTTNNPGTDIRAQVPQANVLEALAVAADELESAGGGNLIMLDSGLQTTAPLDFTAGLLSDDPQTIASYLKNADELPNLRGLRVQFSGLGWTAPPQQNLSIADRTKVTQIWQEIAYQAGASCVEIDPSAPTSQSALTGLPPVSVVTAPKPAEVPHSCSVTDLNDANNVGFDFNSTAFRDPSGARATLQKLANVMLSTGESVTLTGATSSEGTDQYNQQLSLERADAVKTVLVQLGVPASRISTFGDGSHLPGRLNDRGPNGQLLIGPAIQNRKVVAKLTGPDCPAT